METLDQPYIIHEGKGDLAPLIISIPHCGTQFPKEVSDHFLPHQVEKIDDTDWFLQDLYAFAIELGVTIIEAKYNRWLIDLNRDPESAPLYNDGRIITGLTTTTDFLGKAIYRNGAEPDQAEIERRLKHYYWPYYKKIETLLAERLAVYSDVILWDAHSIRASVPTIRSEKFPEMILGDADEQSAHKSLIKVALDNLSKGYQVNHNDPFKGGHITRYFGNPEKGVHALQLERNKELYMDDAELKYDVLKAEKMQVVLRHTLSRLIDAVKSL